MEFGIALASNLDGWKTAKRAEELFAKQTISGVEHEQAVTRARSLDKSAEAAKSRYDLLLAGTRPEKTSRSVPRLIRYARDERKPHDDAKLAPRISRTSALLT